MKVRAISLLLALGAAGIAGAANFESPEAAVRALEDAYARRDANAAVAARDFTEEARRMLQSIGSGLEKEADILKLTAEVLELAYRKDLKENIFRRFKSVRCAVTSVAPVEDALVKVLEDCTLKSGEVSKEHLHVARTANGWRVITIPNP
jgi:hypothetical protein